MSMKKKLDKNFIWSALVHLGGNMWDDFESDPDGWARSAEEEKIRPNPFGPSTKKKMRSRYHSYVLCVDEIWRRVTDAVAASGCNQVIIDVGEGVAYPSHPELKIAGTWSAEKLHAEIARLRGLGLEPIPKLNFSATHDAWLKEYHRMLSTPVYYKVVADVIRDTAEIFDHPRYFHIGYDEEHADDQHNHFHVTARRADQWWHDINYTIGQVEKNGAQAMMWADAIWYDHETFIRRMSKNVIQQNWYYRRDFSPKALAWKPEFERTRKGWPELVHGAAAFRVLQDAGFTQIPCTSNYFEEEATDAFVKYCLENLDLSKTIGLCTAPWARMRVDTEEVKGEKHLLKGIRQFAEAKGKYVEV